MCTMVVTPAESHNNNMYKKQVSPQSPIADMRALLVVSATAKYRLSIVNMHK